MGETIDKIRKGSKVPPMPFVYYEGHEFDRIIYQWVQDLQNALNAIEKALTIRQSLADDAWNDSSNDYTAMCKWTETALDSLRQWESESGRKDYMGTLSQVAAKFDWKPLTMFRNNLSHSFTSADPSDVRLVVNEMLPKLKVLLNLIAICPSVTERYKPFTFPLYSLDYLKRMVTPLTIQEGASLEIGSSILDINYDNQYYPRIQFSGYDENGLAWAVQPYHSSENIKMGIAKNWLSSPKLLPHRKEGDLRIGRSSGRSSGRRRR